jgi:hypothetical protein
VPQMREGYDYAHRSSSVAACPAVGRGIGQLAALAAVAVVGALAAGCGSSQTFTASEFVDRINAEGVSIQLGRQLSTGGDAKELYAVGLPPLPGEPAPPPGSEGSPGASGSLYVYGDNGGAGDQLEACRGSGGLVCLQASNVVVVLDEEASGLAARRLGVAIRRLAQ